MFADMATGIEAGRLLTYKSAYLIDQGLPNTMFASMAKCFTADHAQKVASDAVQIFGGAGFNTEVHACSASARRLPVRWRNMCCGHVTNPHGKTKTRAADGLLMACPLPCTCVAFCL